MTTAKNPVLMKNMPVEATDVDQPFDASAEHNAEPDVQDAPDVQEPDTPPQSPKQKRGRPAGSKDKQPRRRPVRAVSPVRPVTRRAVSRQTKRVQIVESASEASLSAE